MHLLYAYLSLVLCISGVDGDKHHHIKGKLSYQIRSFSKTSLSQNRPRILGMLICNLSVLVLS